MITKLEVDPRLLGHSAADAAVARADQERSRQGLPARISDPAILDHVAEVLGLSELLSSEPGDRAA